MNHALLLEPAALPSALPPCASKDLSGEAIAGESLFPLQLAVARRADTLPRDCEESRRADRKRWLRAEQEIFEGVEERRSMWRAGDI